MTGWRPALLIAWRDALRHRGRSVLVLVMIALPVLAVSAAAIVLKTSDVSGAEKADRVMGAADALVRTEGAGRMWQAPDPDLGYGGVAPGTTASTADDVRGVLGDDVRLLPIRRGWGAVRVGSLLVDLDVTGVDLRDPLAAPLFDVTAGRLPTGPDEVVANHALLAKGLEVGDRLDLGAGEVTIVGAGRDATHRDGPVLLGPMAAVAEETLDNEAWLVESGPVSWEQVLELNEVGAVVTSRAVLADPPDLSATADRMGVDTGEDELFAVAALIVVMALLEVVLLAGPAFAVGARRQARALALISASGGTPAQARSVVLASGVVLGAVASVVGLCLGIVTGWALLPVAQRYDSSWFGPVEAPVGWLAAIAAFGLLSAFLAAVVPAWIASRQDVVAVLAGRRGDRAPSARTPVLGLVLLGVGIGGASYGAVTSDSGNGALWIAASAVVSVLGMILVVPVVVATLARLGSRLPLTTRYAVRDAARHRTRTVPAVAAVAATVAGVVALGIAVTSDELQNEAGYQPQMAMGSGRVAWFLPTLPGEEPVDPEVVSERIQRVVEDTAPDAEVRTLRGLRDQDADGRWVSVHAEPLEHGSPFSTSAYPGPSVAVGETAAAVGFTGRNASEVDAALAAGRAVVFTDGPVTADEVRLAVNVWSEDADPPEESAVRTVPAAFVVSGPGTSPSPVAMPERLAEQLDVPIGTVQLQLSSGIDEETETRIAEAVRGVTADADVYVERGYQRPDSALIVLLVLGVLGGVLMLGGTLTATFLALSDARPDMATLSAVGAAPRTRRAVAASYALVVGFVGALLGAGVGFIPGIAISRPLTSMGGSGPYLDVPWLLILALVLALPLLTAAVVGLTARSRLPLVARLG